MDDYKIRILVTVYGVKDTNNMDVQKRLRMHFKNEGVTIHELIDEVFIKAGLFEKYEFLQIKIFDELFNENVEIIDLNELVTDVTKYYITVRKNKVFFLIKMGKKLF